MRLVDVNVLVYAFREDTPHHAAVRSWVTDMLQSDAAYAVSDHILAGFLRVATHPSIFSHAAPLYIALAFASTIRTRPNAVLVAPGKRHWDIFTRLCTRVQAAGNLVPDAWLAALAIEHGCEFVTTDRDFAQFPELRCLDPRHPTD
jgi:toxin-antitoxin system PIN domain toxin